jgi:hypothetical protein
MPMSLSYVSLAKQSVGRFASSRCGLVMSPELGCVALGFLCSGCASFDMRQQVRSVRQGAGWHVPVRRLRQLGLSVCRGCSSPIGITGQRCMCCFSFRRGCLVGVTEPSSTLAVNRTLRPWACLRSAGYLGSISAFAICGAQRRLLLRWTAWPDASLL